MLFRSPMEPVSSTLVCAGRAFRIGIDGSLAAGAFVSGGGATWLGTSVGASGRRVDLGFGRNRFRTMDSDALLRA